MATASERRKLRKLLRKLDGESSGATARRELSAFELLDALHAPPRPFPRHLHQGGERAFGAGQWGRERNG
eukprot:CAMPEP_0203825804 /NCGR_PEP_ID=MMETSP0115-20131106/55156_1 /ASSEMBLY_ACC=CAM_ASM_000227 /TAXON_ID=33651 /ORGANISM="Bicosoecid sp, Strain ms1" /LENGTH=69 /DNA_ID=CAMNT_0050734849 /DNA_START=94 /DNA_END=300 /DNA_ORIENTATION=-